MFPKYSAAWPLSLTIVLLISGILLAQEDTPAGEGAGTAPAHLRSARATIRTFLSAVDADNLDRAVECLDWSGESISVTKKKELVIQLKGVMDRMAWVDYAQISYASDGSEYRFPPKATEQPIVIARGANGAWRFTANTVAQIPDLFQAWQDKPLLIRGTPWYRKMTPLGMEAWRMVALFLSILLAWIAGWLLQALLRSIAGSLERRKRHYASVTLQALSRAVVPMALVLGLTLGLHFLVLIPVVKAAAETVVAILFVIAAGYAIWRMVDVVDIWLNDAAARTSSKLDDMLAPMICASLRVTILVLVLVQIATILSEKPPSAIIASLGVGGLAIGLAAQDTIKNFFGSVMIFSDRPFELGDRIQFDSYDGTVESVGSRSTRVRTRDGHLITVPNGDLANQAIRNVSKRRNIRHTMKLGLTYDTTPDKVREAIDIVISQLTNHEGQDADQPARIHFNEFADSALILQVTLWYHPADWGAFCDFNQRLNLQILEQFNAAGIEFAFPTQTIHVVGDASA